MEIPSETAGPVGALARPCYKNGMVVRALQTILDRIDTWPPERQERAAKILTIMDEQAGHEDVQVSDEDLAEIDRRIADVDAPSISLEEFDRRFARWLR